MIQHKTKIFFTVLLFAGTISFAQSSIPPTPSTNSTSGATPPGLPIDGGLSLLLVAGTFFGIKKSLKK